MKNHDPSIVLSALVRATDQTPWKVLVADDDRDMRHVLSVVLERGGLSVVPAADGLEAWCLLEKGDFDLLVTDNDMPGLSGLELVELLRAAGTQLPVILITGGAFDDGSASNLEGLRLDAVLRKPFRLEEFAETVLRILSGVPVVPAPAGFEPAAAVVLSDAVSETQ